MALLLAFGAAFVAPVVAQSMGEPLTATSAEGTPPGTGQAMWMKASGSATRTHADSGDTIAVKASGLVANGLYTLWGVNMEGGMTATPLGGAPANEFRADASGNATHSVSVSANAKFAELHVAYHADNQTHGNSPGAMGTETFGHLTGKFPAAAMMGDMGMMEGTMPKTGNGDLGLVMSVLALAALALGVAGLVLRRARA
jgi:hypothetical protein